MLRGAEASRGEASEESKHPPFPPPRHPDGGRQLSCRFPGSQCRKSSYRRFSGPRAHDHHLSVESSKAKRSKGSSPQHHRIMFRAFTSRGVFVRVVCILSLALIFAVGVVQAVHTHPEDSTASHHTCSICSTAHASLSTVTVTAAPIPTTAALVAPPRERRRIFSAPQLFTSFVLHQLSDPAFTPLAFP